MAVNPYFLGMSAVFFSTIRGKFEKCSNECCVNHSKNRACFIVMLEQINQIPVTITLSKIYISIVLQLYYNSLFVLVFQLMLVASDCIVCSGGYL